MTTDSWGLIDSILRLTTPGTKTCPGDPGFAEGKLFDSFEMQRASNFAQDDNYNVNNYK